MATESIFTPEQSTTVTRLGTALTFLAPLALLAGLLRIAIGAVDVFQGNWAGLLAFPSGALLAFAGLAFLAGSTDAKYLQSVKGREKEHFSNTLASINAAFTALLIFGSYEAFLALITILV